MPPAPPKIGPVKNSERAFADSPAAASALSAVRLPQRASSYPSCAPAVVTEARPFSLSLRAVLGRLQSFLPQLAAANDHLQQRIASGETAAIDIEVIEGARTTALRSGGQGGRALAAAKGREHAASPRAAC